MSEPLRWGILGAGGIAATVTPDIAATEGNVLQAVAARDPQRAQAFATAHGVRRAAASYADLLAADDIDVVYIATTHAQHHELAVAALQAGKPILVEKAFTLNAAQASDVVAHARAHQLFCMEGMWMRMHPLIREARRLIVTGEIGAVLAVHADLSKHFPYDPNHRLFDLRVGGGALLDLGVYPVNLVWLVLGAPRTQAATGVLAPTGADLTAALQWGYPAAVAQIFCTAAAYTPAAGLITGTAGWIRLEGRVHHPRALTVHTEDGERVIESPTIAGNGFRAEIAEVARCLRSGLLESPLMPLDDTVGVMRMLDDARRQLGVRYPADDEPTADDPAAAQSRAETPARPSQGG